MAAALLGACAGKIEPIGQNPAVVRVESDSMPTPDAALTGGSGAFRVQPFDKLRIEVFGVEDLQRTVAVDGDGRMAFPLVGQIQASGKTAAELASEIESGLRQGNYVRRPDVSVNVVETPGRTVAVDGQVNRPGEFPVLPNATMLRAVAQAGGTTQYARTDDVVLLRNIGDKHYVGLYNLAAIRRGNYPDPPVYANDVIVVGESKQSRLFEKLIQGASLITTPLILLFQNGN